MVREDILGGLKLAVSKGESLKQAMMSFYNAGYKKEDIEGAAKSLLQIQQQTQPVQPQKPVQQPKKQILKPKPIQPKQPIQRVSGYGQKPSKVKEKLVLFLLIFILIVLLGTLTSVFVFKSEVIEFLNNMFGV